MHTVAASAFVLCAFLCVTTEAVAQRPVGALAIDERQGDQWGWAVDYETSDAAQAAALSECGVACSVVLTFERCAAHATDQDADSTAVGWAESYGSAAAAQQAALSNCRSRGGRDCIVRVWGCNGSVVEEGLDLDAASRRQVQEGLQATGFDPGGADGMFGPRTRAALRRWQASRGDRATGYLDSAAAAVLRSVVAGPAAAVGPIAVPPLAATAEQETVFWQSIANSTNPAEFEAYLAQFPNGVFRALAEARLAGLGAPAGGLSGAARPSVGDVGPSASSSRAGSSSVGLNGSVDAPGEPSSPSRSGPTCAGQPADAACWMEIAQQPGCYVWQSSLTPGATVTWTGECVGGFAHGAGTLTWIWNEGQRIDTGHLVVYGKQTGHWALRFANGSVLEGPMVNGEQNGRWVFRYADGGIDEGPMVGGQRNGHWVSRYANGNVGEGPYVNNERNGHWVFRAPDGTVVEGPVVGGEEHGDWVRRRPDGRVEVQRWEHGQHVDR